MTLADVPAVVVLERTIFTSPWSRYAFEHEIQHNPNACFVVLHKGPSEPATDLQTCQQPLLGYGGFWLILDEAHICTLGVRPDWRGRSLGELLLVHLIDRASALNAALLTLEVRVSNQVAQHLYAKYGFVCVGSRKSYYSDNSEDALIMTTEHIHSQTYEGHLRELKETLWHRLAEQQLTIGTPPC
jgi:ribosomal-protein-alanine N-acetyltransferase